MGSIAVFDNKHKQWLVSDTSGLKKTSLPASTFKIINLLIALETGIIADENQVVKWVGHTDTSRYGYRPEIYHDMSVKKHFRFPRAGCSSSWQRRSAVPAIENI